jgi:hypothetical protein
LEAVLVPTYLFEVSEENVPFGSNLTLSLLALLPYGGGDFTVAFSAMSAVPVNRTIDDTKLRDDWTAANVTYSGGWAAQPNYCPTCSLIPDNKTLVMDGTWHYSRTNLSDITTPNSFTLTFPGEPTTSILHVLL